MTLAPTSPKSPEYAKHFKDYLDAFDVFGRPRWDGDGEREFWRFACRESFWTFLMFCFGAEKRVKENRPWIDPNVHRPMCDWFEGHVKDWIQSRAAGRAHQKHLAVLIPREMGKTTIFTKAGLLWLHLLDSELSTYIGSEKTEFACDFLSSIKMILDGSDPDARFTWLYGNGYDPRRVWKSDAVTHAFRRGAMRTEPSFGAWGVESGLTGKHPDVLCLDDPTSYEKMASHINWLTTVNNHMDSLIPVLTTDGLLMIVGTRYHDGDHFGRSFRLDGVKSITGMPMPDVAVRPDGLWDVYFMAARDSKGVPTCPRTWPEHRLASYERKDPLKYAAQVMNDPANSEFNPLTRAQIDLLWIEDREVPKRLTYTMHCDTAFKTTERQARGDESVIEIWGHSRDGSGDVFFLEGYGSNIWRAEQYAEKLAILIQKYKKAGKRITMITDEMTPGGKDGAWELALQSFCHHAGVSLPPFKTLGRGGKKKLGRIIEAASFWSDGHVRLPKNAPGVERLVEQMARIGSAAHDDWSDAAADVFHKECYNVLHRQPEKDEEGEPLEGRRPFDEYLKPGGLGEDLMDAELWGIGGHDPI